MSKDKLSGLLANYTDNLCLLMYLGINSLFILKYGLRIVPLSFAMAACVFYAIFILVALNFFRWITERVSHTVLFSVMAVLLSVLVIVQVSIDPYQLRLDRWSAIHNFLHNLFRGIYPYAAQTHLGGYGSPFPVWQLFHIPFYLLGNVGLSFFCVVGLFVDSIRRVFGTRQAMVAFLLLLSSPAFVYEVVTRSDLMTNFLLCSAIIFYMYHCRFSFRQHYVWISLVIGLMASTRLSAVIPFAVFFFSNYLKSGYRCQLLSALIVVLVFALSFLPFLLWNGEMLLFFEYNPFVLQSRQGNLSDFLLFIPLGIWLAMTWRGDINRYAMHTALLLVLLVVVTFVHNMYMNGNWDALFQPSYDITYFNMALPFLILPLINKQTNV